MAAGVVVGSMTALRFSECEHVPHPNPRQEGRCVRCGREIPPEDYLGGRQPQLEREFLRGAERLAGLDIGWLEQVQDRLLRMERAKGRDSYRQLGVMRCVREAEEETLDLGGWPLMAALLSYAAELDADVAHEFRLKMQEAAAHGVRAARVLAEARELLG